MLELGNLVKWETATTSSKTIHLLEMSRTIYQATGNRIILLRRTPILLLLKVGRLRGVLQGQLRVIEFISRRFTVSLGLEFIRATKNRPVKISQLEFNRLINRYR